MARSKRGCFHPFKPTGLLKLFKLVSLVKNSDVVHKQLLRRTNLNPAVERLVELFLFLFLIWHWVGCLWWYIGQQQGTVTEHNLIELPEGCAGNHACPGYEYVTSYYWAVLVTTSGETPVVPTTHAEAVYEALMSFLGVCMQAYMLGSATSALSNIDAASTNSRRKLDAVKQYVLHKRVPMFLREKIIEYYEYLYCRASGGANGGEDRVLRCLPATLKVQLAVVLNQEFLKRVPIFKYCDPRCVAILVLFQTSVETKAHPFGRPTGAPSGGLAEDDRSLGLPWA